MQYFFFSPGPRGLSHLFCKSTVLYTCILYIQLHKNNINMICKLFTFTLVSWGLLKYIKGKKNSYNNMQYLSLPRERIDNLFFVFLSVY